MNFNNLCCGALLLFIGVFPAAILGGDHGLVDDEIWHHVTKVLSAHEGHGKVLLSHPQPAHLVDAYTKVFHHEPHYDNYHHEVYDGHHGHHGYHGGHHDDHRQHYEVNPHHYHHHAPPPVPVYKLPVPVVSAYRYGPPPPLRHYHHYKK